MAAFTFNIASFTSWLQQRPNHFLISDQQRLWCRLVSISYPGSISLHAENRGRYWAEIISGHFWWVFHTVPFWALRMSYVTGTLNPTNYHTMFLVTHALSYRHSSVYGNFFGCLWRYCAQNILSLPKQGVLYEQRSFCNLSRLTKCLKWYSKLNSSKSVHWTYALHCCMQCFLLFWQYCNSGRFVWFITLTVFLFQIL